MLNGSHLDAVDALVYLVRNINVNKNPYPPGYSYRGTASQDLFKQDISGKYYTDNPELQRWGKTFERKSSLGQKRKDRSDLDKQMMDIYNRKKINK